MDILRILILPICELGVSSFFFSSSILFTNVLQFSMYRFFFTSLVKFIPKYYSHCIDYFIMCEHFSSVYLCIPYACLVIMRARRETPLEQDGACVWQGWMGAWGFTQRWACAMGHSRTVDKERYVGSFPTRGIMGQE